jgi:hypothetical protein
MYQMYVNFSSQWELFVSEVPPICCVSDKVTIQCKTCPELILSLDIK